MSLIIKVTITKEKDVGSSPAVFLSAFPKGNTSRARAGNWVDGLSRHYFSHTRAFDPGFPEREASESRRIREQLQFVSQRIQKSWIAFKFVDTFG